MLSEVKYILFYKMSQEIRNEIIRQNLPQLIKNITGFTESNDAENMRRCELFAWGIIKNHRNLSTNSHEIRRKIEAIQEKFTVDNQADVSDHLKILCLSIAEHPLCQKHYEVDVGWSIIDFLLSLAYNPTTHLRKNKHKIDFSITEEEDDIEEPSQQEREMFKKLLQEDFINTDYYGGSDSDLSVSLISFYS